MIIDGQNLFSENQAVTAAAVSSNVIDMTTARDVGTGEELEIFVTVTETLDDVGDNSTLAIALVTDNNAALSSPTTVRSLVTLPANTAAGTTLYFCVDPQYVAFERYLGLSYTPANGDLSAGKITAGLVRTIQKSQNYPASGFTVT